MWPYLLALTALPCVVSACILPWFPDSPRYLLVKKNDEDGATKGRVSAGVSTHTSCVISWAASQFSLWRASLPQPTSDQPRVRLRALITKLTEGGDALICISHRCYHSFCS